MVSPAVLTRHYRTLVFDPSLEIILETEGTTKRAGEADIAIHGSVNGADLSAIKQFIAGKSYSVDIKGVCISIYSMSIQLRGYPLSADGSRWISCAAAPHVYEIPIMFPKERIITTVEYFYHMMTTS
jgi:hypothetical protein